MAIEQFSIFSFDEKENLGDPVLLERLGGVALGQCLGYAHLFSWGNGVNDYFTLIEKNGVLFRATIKIDDQNPERDQLGYNRRYDFSWFWFIEDEQKHGKKWRWRSLDDKLKIMEINK